jgi:hypothetical protein
MRSTRAASSLDQHPAVEIHQSTVGSSDTAFDLRLTADVLQTVEPGVKPVRPEEGDTFRAGADRPQRGVR